MKKVCFFCGNISRAAGTERITTVIANELSKSNYEVYILSVVHGEKSFFDLESDIKLLSLQMEGRSSNFSSIATIRKLHSLMKKYSFDYIIDVDILGSFYSIPASFGTPVKVISWEHFHYYINLGGFVQRLKRTLSRKLASRFSDYIVTLTKKDQQQYIKNLNTKAKIVAINNPLTVIDGRKAKLESKTVLAVGRLTYQKGFDLLLHTWKKVIEKNSEWTLKIVGSGEDEDMLKKLSEQLSLTDNIEFISKTKNVEDYYLNASIFVFPSRFEGFGLVLVEAKSFGLPIISFDCDCGPSDIVRDGVDGILIEAGNTDKFANGLLDLIENEDKRYEFGENALLDSRFDIDNIIPQWQKILK